MYWPIISHSPKFILMTSGLGWKSVGGYSSVVKQLKAVVEWPWKKEKDFKHMGVCNLLQLYYSFF